MKDKEYKVNMLCPVCGNDQFEIDEANEEDLKDDSKITCSDCKHVFTRSELIEENKGIINARIDDIKDDFVKDFEKELKKIFKK